MAQDLTVCPHCGEKMSKFQTPGECTWGETYWWVCFNDECGYYKRGWDHMFNTRGIKCSYRHRYDPDTNSCGPMPVYSEAMGKHCIVK
jgi:hypothetical protein